MMLEQHSKSMDKLSIPPILYGTAWKEENTERLVTQALTLGFKGIDTANQRKHYFEEGVGFAVQKLYQIASNIKFIKEYGNNVFTSLPATN